MKFALVLFALANCAYIEALTFSAGCIPYECGNFAVIIAVDASLSISPDEYKDEIRFVKKFADVFKVGNGKYIGVVNYSVKSTVVIEWDTYTSVQGFRNGVHTAVNNGQLKRDPQGFSTNTDAAILDIGKECKEVRAKRPYITGCVGVVITDGESRSPAATKAAANQVKGEGTMLAAVGVGSLSTRALDELKEIASDESTVFTINQFGKLNDYVHKIIAAACHMIGPGPCRANGGQCLPPGVCKSRYFPVIRGKCPSYKVCCKPRRGY